MSIKNSIRNFHSKHRFTPSNSISRFNLPAHSSNSSRSPTFIKLNDSIKSQFNTLVPLLAIKIPTNSINEFKSHPFIKTSILKSKSLRSVEPDPDSKDGSHKLLLLNTSKIEEIPQSTLTYFKENSIELKNWNLELNWDYWNADEVLSSLLPTELSDIPSSFTIIGHIAHFNLRDEFLPFKYLIGQVILEKNLAIKTVVNKIDSINSQFRFFQMELLAGEPNYQVTLWQSGCRYRFDFSKVYYNPRLSTEHDLLSSKIQKDEIVVDAFAGVGPFALRAASSQKAWVFASDLNPSSVEALRVNVKLNKLQGRVQVSEGDGRERIRKSVFELWHSNPLNLPSLKLKLVDHFIINLPDSSIGFLDAFIGLYDCLVDSPGFLECLEQQKKLPLLHCYCFTKKVEVAEMDINERVSQVLKYKIDSSQAKRYELKFVRQVAPHKEMYRITFELPIEVLLSCKKNI
ncbi:hypothetical protein O181_042582 [Austropuccinia psidii MF-1]|uniref:tRNA (guanine(37)-N1)-methyltransferase n=1 Tax=Austropuccinia psidii MF-1 TaxID=1389203 RepID=A0A9Q3DIX0_9BASI|nr:hypothetical protein [Austropuccinia psidii MF-1]